MTKSGLIEAVAEKTPHISKKDTEIVVNTIFDSMTHALKSGERIEIRGFGSFQVKVREAREGRMVQARAELHDLEAGQAFAHVGVALHHALQGLPARPHGEDHAPLARDLAPHRRSLPAACAASRSRRFLH